MNFTRKTDIVGIAKRWVRIHSSSRELFLNRIAKTTKSLRETKRFLFLWAAPERKQWKPFQSQCQCRSFECEWFPQIFEKKYISVQNLADIHFLWISVHFPGDNFVFHDSNNFCSLLSSLISLTAQVQLHAKYSLFDSQSERECTFSYAILTNLNYQPRKRKLCSPCTFAEE